MIRLIFVFCNFVTGVFKSSNGSAFHGLLTNEFSLYALILFIIYLGMIISILVTIFHISKGGNKKLGFKVLILLFLAFVSQIFVGNVPSSIISCPGYLGRYWIIFNAILMLPNRIIDI